MKHIEEINDIVKLERYRLLWKAMLSETRDATFFHTLDWLVAYWKHYGQGQQLRVLVAWDGDRPIGILPLVLKREETRVGTVRVLTYPLHDWGTFYGPLGPEPAAMLRLGMSYLRQGPQDWDLLDLRWVDEQGADGGRCYESMESSGFAPCRQGWDQAAVVDLRGEWDDYWQSRSRKWRKGIRHDLRCLHASGNVEVIRYRPKGTSADDDDPRWDLFDACVALAKSSWQGRSTTGSTISHASVAPFLRDAHEAAVRNGAVDLNLLLLDGQPIAFVYNYHHRGRLFGLRMGFDPAHAATAPGKVLQYLMFKDSFERGDTHFDLGVGSLEVKRHWITSVVTSYRLTCFSPNTLRAQLLRLKHWYVGHRVGSGYLAGGKSARLSV